MKIALAQINFTIGDFVGNVAKMLDAVESAKNDGADIVCFAELATCGYPPRDFLEFEDFIRQSGESINILKKASRDIAIIVGSPSVNPVIEGKDLYNSAYFLAEGQIKFVQHKTLLPTYDIFDEYRYFEPNNHFNIIEYKGVKIALSICEDLWNLGNENPLYTICPMDQMMLHKPDIMINVSASPYDYEQAEERMHVLKENVKRYQIPLFYVNHVGANTEIIFDGGSTVISPNAKVYREMPFFKEAVECFELEKVMHNEEESRQPASKIPMIQDALVLGVRDYFRKLGFKKAIIGLSGGLDSALTTVLAVKALGKENVRVLLMPSQFSSDHSVKDAEDLAKNLDIEYNIIEIEPIYKAYMKSLDVHFQNTAFNVAEENLQARARGNLLMAISNKFGHILLNTTNKSEMAVGYGTLYGDLAGGISVIGDVYKTEVFELSRYINRNMEIIPENTINKPPSAELRPNQKDSDSLPEYDILDRILYEYIEKEQGPNEIIKLGYDEKLVKRILRMVNINEFKRYQTAPVLRVSPKAFGIGRRVPIVARYLS